MATRVKMPVSRARARLFELTDFVRHAGDDTAVVLERRGNADNVVMVREARLAYLETRVAELERLVAGPFTLAGSLASPLDEAALDGELRAIRHDWATNRQPPVPHAGSSGRGVRVSKRFPSRTRRR